MGDTARARMAPSVLLAIVYLAFVSLGLPDGVFGVAWPAMRRSLGEPLEAAGIVTLLSSACGALSGFASGAVLRRISTGTVVAISGALTGLALLGMSWAPALAWLLVLAVPLGLGAGAVDAAMNHFVARHYSSRQMNWLHASWGVGATVGPLAMGWALAQPAGWPDGYRILGLVQLALAAIVLATLGLWRHAPRPAAAAEPVDPSREPARTPPDWAAWLAPSLYPFYALIEVGTGLWAASILVEQRGMPGADAGGWVALFFGAIMLGRVGVGFISVRVGNRRLVRAGLATAGLGCVLFGVSALPPLCAAAGLLLMGLGCAPIYPSLMHETTRRFDAETARRVVGRQVAFAALGASLCPPALGLIGAWLGLGWIAPCVLAAIVLLALLSWQLDRVT